MATAGDTNIPPLTFDEYETLSALINLITIYGHISNHIWPYNRERPAHSWLKRQWCCWGVIRLTFVCCHSIDLTLFSFRELWSEHWQDSVGVTCLVVVMGTVLSAKLFLQSLKLFLSLWNYTSQSEKILAPSSLVCEIDSGHPHLLHLHPLAIKSLRHWQTGTDRIRKHWSLMGW